MCAHYTLFSENEALQCIMRAAQSEADCEIAADIFPGMWAPVLKAEGSTLRPTIMIWGFPVNAKDGPMKRVFNTRVETARTKPLWRRAYAHRRCLIPATGFEEWQHHPGGKTLFRFSANQGPLYIAGIYERREDGNEYFSMLTTQPNDDIQDVHDRMPLVLHQDEVDTWLHGAYDTLADRAHIPLRRVEIPQDIQQLSLF